MTRIKGIRQVVSRIKGCPGGWHCEVWSRMSGEDVEVWATEYMTPNEWTANHPKGHRRIDDSMDEVYRDAEWRGERRPSTTEAVRRAVAIVWGIDPSGEDEAAAVKTIRRSGGALVVTVTDMARALDLEEGDTADVTIRRRD